MEHSLDSDSVLPKFYVMLDDNRIVGTYALLRNDLISRQDLYPWFACLFVEPVYRGNKIGSQLLEHAKKQANEKGFKKL
jgi:N-acetylglutamate synthase-like GNAT family acetyltransferase